MGIVTCFKLVSHGSVKEIMKKRENLTFNGDSNVLNLVKSYQFYCFSNQSYKIESRYNFEFKYKY